MTTDDPTLAEAASEPRRAHPDPDPDLDPDLDPDPVPDAASTTQPDFRALFESAPGLYLVLDPDLVIVAASNAYLAATMTERGEVMGRPVFEVFPDNPDDPDTEGVRNLKASLARVRRERRDDVMSVQKYDVQRPDSEGGGFEERFWSPHNSPVLQADGSLAYIIHQVQDVTDFIRLERQRDAERPLEHARFDAMEAEVVRRAREVADAGRALKEANEQLEVLYSRSQELDRLKTEFFSNVSHELRTPLSLILAPAERLLAEEELPPDGRGRRDLEVILRNARVLLAHVNDLLDASKIEAAKLELEYAELDLAHLVRIVANSFETLAVDRAVHFVVVAPEDEVPAQVDPRRVHQVLLNLLSNAFKLTPKDGTVRIELRNAAGGDAVQVEVADSGPGIPPDRRDEVFGRFHQLDGTSTRKMPGTGLGLHIAKELVQLHGGSIGVAQAPEGGALFLVELPLQAPEGAEVRADDPTARTAPAPSDTFLAGYTASGPQRDAPPDLVADLPQVLVIEDNVDMNRFVCEALAPAFRVYGALDGREGLELARAVKPDLIVCDFMMTELGGDELVRAVRADESIDSTPILILTARNDSTARIDVLRSGASDYLLKPFFQPELRARVDNLVKVKQSEKTLRALEMANERDRIARDLHDLVIQRVFGVGMRLTSMLGGLPASTGERVREVVDELDKVIADIRTTIFDLQAQRTAARGLRRGVLQLSSDASERLDFRPRVHFDGPIDTAVDREMADQLLAVLRESLSNIIRHAGASAVEVTVAAEHDDLVLRVADDGVGPAPPDTRVSGFGLRNMESRARSLGGTCRVRANEPRGTVVEWRVPLRTG
ncbi:MAG TPA: ATP-binding protein [Acidimicrobiales bacterium]|nr:ATP-binding protein [Acidimicrobiales bacterium]